MQKRLLTISLFLISISIALSGMVQVKSALAQGRVVEYLAVWSKDLRIFAQQADTRVKLIDIDTGLPLSLSDPRIGSCNMSTNPFVLHRVGDSFEGIAGKQGATEGASLATGTPLAAEIRIKIMATDISGKNKTKGVTVWTGSLSSQYRHPGPGIDAAAIEENPDPWMAFLPAITQDLSSPCSKVGKEFIGFSTAEMYIFAQKGSSASAGGAGVKIMVEDFETNTDLDSDDTFLLDASSPYCIYKDNSVEIYYIDTFDDDTVRIYGNTRMSVLVGLGSQSSPDWAVSVPAFDTGQESGTEFYTFAHDQLAIFPTQDNTIVTLIDCSDYDDSRVCTLANGSLTKASYDIVAITQSSAGGGEITPRSQGPKVNLLPASLNNNVFDNDLVKITSTKPVFVQAGPVGDIRQQNYLNVTATFPNPTDDLTDSKTYLTYVYTQSCGSGTGVPAALANDRNMRIFAYDATTHFSITSLSFIATYLNYGHHDFDINSGINSNSIDCQWGSHPGSPQNSWTAGTCDGEVFWSSGDFQGEMLRIVSDKPLVVFSGNDCTPNSGTFVPCQPATFPLPPVAVIESAGGDSFLVPIFFDATSSYDRDVIPGKQIAYYSWDFDVTQDSDGDGIPDNDSDSRAASISHAYPHAGSYTARLTFSDDDGQVDSATTQIILGEGGLRYQDTVISLTPAYPQAGSAVTAMVEISLPDVSYYANFSQLTSTDNTFKIYISLIPPPPSSTYHPNMTIQQRYTYFLGNLEKGNYRFEVYQDSIEDKNYLTSKSFSVEGSSSSSSSSSSSASTSSSVTTSYPWDYVSVTSSGGHAGTYTYSPLSTPTTYSLGQSYPSYTAVTSPLAISSSSLLGLPLSTRSVSSYSPTPAPLSLFFPYSGSYSGLSSYSAPSSYTMPSSYPGLSIWSYPLSTSSISYYPTNSMAQPYYYSNLLKLSWY